MHRTSTILGAVAGAALLALILIQFVSASNGPLSDMPDTVAAPHTSAQAPDVTAQAMDDLAAWPAGAVR